MALEFTHRPLNSSFWGLPYRILNINRIKELLRGLWVGFRAENATGTVVLEYCQKGSVKRFGKVL